ncbi:ribonuclease T2 family protein [Neoaquamicrobium sediminum]|uniref:ribonuclease T2 family protein n=1 Tax=Neoaquamicrobium sediminum TaxID=1849104 RepID=UPI00360DC1DD
MVIFTARIIQAPLLAVLLVASACAPSASQQPDLPTGDGFDFFVLSLSWSPSYCAAEGSDANRQQCGTGRDHAFVVHGLWPQFESGWPEFCDSTEPERVPDATVRQMLDVMPSAGLVGHQWRKHGSCAGMSQQDYFSVVRAARDRINIPTRFARSAKRVEIEPDDVEADFIAANPTMPEDGIAVTCDGRFVREVRICMTKELEFRSCAEVNARACRMPRALMPAPGG